MDAKAPALVRDFELACPIDGSRLEKRREGEVTYDRCATCGGTWFDASELAASGGDDVERAAKRVAGVVGVSRFGCPRCWGDCLQVRIGVVVADTCTTCHGVWLDSGEMEAARREVVTMRFAQERLTPLQRLVLRIEDAVKL